MLDKRTAFTNRLNSFVATMEEAGQDPYDYLHAALQALEENDGYKQALDPIRNIQLLPADKKINLLVDFSPVTMKTGTSLLAVTTSDNFHLLFHRAALSYSQINELQYARELTVLVNDLDEPTFILGRHARNELFLKPVEVDDAATQATASLTRFAKQVVDLPGSVIFIGTSQSRPESDIRLDADLADITIRERLPNALIVYVAVCDDLREKFKEEGATTTLRIGDAVQLAPPHELRSLNKGKWKTDAATRTPTESDQT